MSEPSDQPTPIWMSRKVWALVAMLAFVLAFGVYLRDGWLPNRNRLAVAEYLWQKNSQTCPEAVVLGGFASQQIFGGLVESVRWGRDRINWFTYEDARPLELYLVQRELIAPKCPKSMLLVEMTPASVGPHPLTSLDIVNRFLTDQDETWAREAAAFSLRHGDDWSPQLALAAQARTIQQAIWFWSRALPTYASVRFAKDRFKGQGGPAPDDDRIYVGGIDRASAGALAKQAVKPSRLHVEAIKRLATEANARGAQVYVYAPPVVPWLVEHMQQLGSLQAWCDVVAELQEADIRFVDGLIDPHLQYDQFISATELTSGGARVFLRETFPIRMMDAQSATSPPYCG